MLLCSLMLLPALLDPSTACPLILQPKELVQEFGETALLNCTTTVDGHRGMYWTHGDEKQEESLDSFIVLPISLTDWNTQARCTIKLSYTNECSEEVKVKVYKRPTSITVHPNGPAIEGKHLELDCRVRGVAIVHNLTVTWYINNTVVQMDSFSPSTNTPTNKISFLKWNVSRAEDGATFTCEASDLEPRGGPLYVSNATWELSVEYAPEFEVNEEVQYVNNSDEVRLHCGAMGNPPPHYNWIRDEVTIKNNTSYFVVGRVNENMTFSCRAFNYLGFVVKKFTIIVNETSPAPDATPATPKSTGCPLLTITPEKILVKLGDSASASCSTTETDADGIGWEATPIGIGLTPVTHLPWTVKAATWTTAATCFLSYNETFQCTKPLDITIWKSPDEVQVSPHSSGSMTEGKPFQLKCDIFEVANDTKLQVKWYRDDEMIETDRGSTVSFMESDANTKNVTSILELTPEIEHNGANFTCVAELLLGQERNPEFTSKPFTADVQYKPVVTCPKTYSGKEDDLELDVVPCIAQGNPEPVVYWYFKDKLVNSTQPLTRRDSGTYMARFANIIGDTNATVDISVEYGPSFSCLDHYKVTENDNLGSECIPKGIPEPKSVWWKDGMEVALPKKWKRQDSGQYSIVATNEHGQANHTLSISVLYAPSFLERATPVKLNQGGNLTLQCSADGNPPPELRWSQHPQAANIHVTSRGSQGSVHITEATSSNEGLYSCTATNEVGSVSKNITLTIIAAEATRPSKNVIFICLALIALLLIIVAFLIYRNYKRKSGHYDIIGRSSSAVPLTNLSKGD